MAARPPQVAGEVKYGYIIVTAMVNSQRDVTRLVHFVQFLSSLDSNRLRGSAVGVCTEACPAVRDAHASCGIFA